MQFRTQKSFAIFFSDASFSRYSMIYKTANSVGALATPIYRYRRASLAVAWILQYLSNGASQKKMAKDFSLRNLTIYSSPKFQVGLLEYPVYTFSSRI